MNAAWKFEGRWDEDLADDLEAADQEQDPGLFIESIAQLRTRFYQAQALLLTSYIIISVLSALVVQSLAARFK